MEFETLNMEIKREQERTWGIVMEAVQEEFSRENPTFRTVNGNTQEQERNNIKFIREILIKKGFSFEEAGSQQSKDFRNVNDCGLDIEIKKTDTTIICCNDTCPDSNIKYIVFVSGREYKRKTENNIKPQVLFISGEEFLEDTEEWLKEFQDIMEMIKNKFGRGESAKKLGGCLSVYPRPNYRVDIRKWLK